MLNRWRMGQSLGRSRAVVIALMLASREAEVRLTPVSERAPGDTVERGRAEARQAGASDAWLAQAKRHLKKMARAPEVTPDGFVLRASGVTARFTAGGVEVGDWKYAFLEQAALSTAPEREDQRVVYRRPGGVTEWYEANERGIEQGFTVAEPAALAGDLVVAGTVQSLAEARAGDGEVGFGALRYSQLKAWDASGRALEAAMEWSAASHTLALRIRAEALVGAVFPVTIDPLLSAPAWTADPTDQAGASFGDSVAGAGDVNGDGFADVVVGANYWDGVAGNEGRAYLYLGSATGLAATPAWTADPTDQAGATFGCSVAGAGDVNGDGYADVVVGADSWHGEAMNEGRAYLYLGAAAGLSATPAWTADPTNQTDACFGRSVAGAGDVNRDGYADVMVGAQCWNAQEGRAYLYLGSALGLSGTPAWTADPTDQTLASFGASVAGAGDVNGDGYADVVVGAPGWSGAAANEGRAYVYLGSATGLSVTPAWTADPTDQIGASFGASVAGAGDVDGDGFADVMVGARDWDGAFSGEGRGYLYLGSATGLSTTPNWTSDPTNQANSTFGISVAGAGDVNGDGFADVLVGAYWWDGLGVDEGRGYLYLGSATGLSGTPAWTADPTDQAFAYFGVSGAGAGDVNGDGFADVLMGAAGWKDGAINEGRAYLYSGSATGLGLTPAWGAEPTDQAAARFGVSIAGVGDVNGDGLTDVVVGAHGWDGEAADEGRAYLYLATPNGLSITPAWTADPTDQTGAAFGRSVAGAGDVNGDGLADVVVGAHGWDGAAGGEGRAYLYLGSAAGLSPTPAWTADPTDQANSTFGFSVAGAGDVNGDGFADVLVGAYSFSDVAADEGRAYLYLGSATGLSATPDWTADPTDQIGAAFGASVAGASDVNGDGFSDVVVGAYFWDGAATDEGRAYLYLGSPTGLSTTPAWAADPTDQVSAWFGSSVAGAGDVNGDGFADVVVGAHPWDGAAGGEGRAYLYLGSATGLAATPAWTADPTNQFAGSFGGSVSGAGDVNGDGFADVVVGAHGWISPVGLEGRAYVYLGSATGLAATPAWTADPTDQIGAAFGRPVAGAGDVNGDGFADVVVAGYDWDSQAIDEGRAYLYLGGDGQPGLRRWLGQFQLDDTTRIGVGNEVGSTVVFKGRVTQEGQVGGGLLLEVEVKSLGAPFTGTGIVGAVPVLPGQTASATVTGLGVGAYHWRARVVYPVKTGHGRWVSFGGNFETEADFRVGVVRDAGATADAGAPDAGESDAGATADAGAPDAGESDAGATADAGAPDAGESDAGASDAGATADAGTSDAGAPDAGERDAGATADAGASTPKGPYAVGCDCSHAPLELMGAAVLLLGVFRRPRRSHARVP